MLLLDLAYKKRRKHATHLLPASVGAAEETTGVYPRLIRSAHRLAAIGVALAGINLLGIALWHSLQFSWPARGIVRIVRFQIGGLLSKRFIAITVTRQTRIVVDIIAIGQAQIVGIARQLTSSSATCVLMSNFMTVKARLCPHSRHANGQGPLHSYRRRHSTINMLAHGTVANRAAEARRIVPRETANASNHKHGKQ